MIDLEEKVIRKLDFNIRDVYSITFLDRYIRLLITNIEQNESNVDQIVKLSREYCKYMQLQSIFLEFKPSLKAAASLLLALNISQSFVAPEIGLKRINEHEIKSLLHRAYAIYVPKLDAKSGQQSPLRLWSKSIECLTSLKQQDI